MKSQIIALLLLATLSIKASEGPNYNKMLVVVAKMSLQKIEDKAKTGDMNSALAMADFQQALQDPSYEINWPGSIKVLKEYELIDDKNRIFQPTREALNSLHQK